LRVWGHELKREGDRIYFYTDSHHGWRVLWTTREDIERHLASKVRWFVSTWAGDDAKQPTEEGTGRPTLDRWEMQQFEALTGFRSRTDTMPAAEWWQKHGDRVVPTFEGLTEFLRIRDEQCLLYWDVAKNPVKYRHSEERSILTTPAIPRARRHYCERTVLAIQRWNRSQRLLWNIVFEACFFPLLAAHFVFLVPAVVARLKERGVGPVVYCSVAGVLIHLGVVLPYMLGYSPFWLTSLDGKGTVIYNGLLWVAEMPVLFILAFLPRPLVRALNLLCVPFGLIFLPVLSPMNVPEGQLGAFTSFGGRGMVFIAGGLAYACLGFVWGLRQRRKSKSESSEAPCDSSTDEVV